MNILPLMLAVALSAGNAEFDLTAQHGAASIAVRRVEAELAEKGPPAGGLEKAMLEASERFVSREGAKEACRGIFAAALKRAFEGKVRDIRERLNLGESFQPISSLLAADNDQLFEAAFEAERKSACEKQAKDIAGAVKPSEAEFESKAEEVLRKEMTAKVAVRQKMAVFEENLKYISETIVDPVIESGRKEMKRQGEYLMRTRCEAYAPSALAKEIEGNLRKNIEERKVKETDPSKQWGVFPKTLAERLPAAVEHRTLERVAKNADDVTVAVDTESILKTIAADPAAHCKMEDSEKIFRGIFAAQVLEGALSRVVEEAPAKERQEFAEYVRAHAAAPEIVRAVETRIRREVLPKWRATRAVAAKQEADRIWPMLADRTWYPDAELADAVAARSDYASVVKAWRTEPALAVLAKQDGGKPLMEETAATADGSVSVAFDLARSAIAAQNAIIGEVEPAVLCEAKDRKSSFWRRTPDLKAIIGMLTAAVEAQWNEKRIGTLWPDEAARPVNVADQHAALFPSVRKRIELVARSILEEMEKPEPEQKPEPEEPPPEDLSESDQQSEEKRLMTFSIVVSREGDHVTVKLEQGKSIVMEHNAKAEMIDYQDAMKRVSDKLGRDILKLK